MNTITVTNFIYTHNSIRYNFLIDIAHEYSDDWTGFVYILKVYEKGKEEDDFFSVILREMENGSELKVVDLYPDRNKYYLGKRISINIILFLKEYFKKRIISSSNNKHSEYCEFNSDIAIKYVWEKLRSFNKVEYCRTRDVYYTL